MRTTRTSALIALALAAGSLLTAQTAAADPLTVSRDVTGLTAGGTSLVTFDSADVGTITDTEGIEGIPGGQTLVGIDFRPAGGKLYGVTDAADGQRLYVIDTESGLATPVGTAPFANVPGDISIDFNPTVDRLRVVSSEGANLRVNPNNGARGDVPTNDGPLAYATTDVNAGAVPAVGAIAYINNDNDCIATPTIPCPTTATGTTLYDLDAALDVLTTQVPPNSGTLNTVGAAGQDLSSDGTGFDVYSPTTGANEAFASLSKNGKSRLFTVSLASGALKPAGKIGADVVDIALPPVQ